MSASEATVYSPNQSISHGASDDINRLINQTVELFDETCTLRIRHFQTIWKQMKFGLIFHGRRSYRELYELIEDLFEIVKVQCLFPKEFGTRAAAFYLLYTLYFKQPLRPRVRIRIDYEQYQDLCQWIDECRDGQHWEIVCCWAKVLTDHAFHFVATCQPVGLENSSKSERFALPTNQSKNVKKFMKMEPLFKQDSFREIMENLQKTHERYTQMKSALNSANLDVAYSDFPSRIQNLAQNNPLEKTPQSGNILKENGLTIGQRRKKLIEQSFGIDAVDPTIVDADELLLATESKDQKKSKASKKGFKKKSVSLDPGQDLKSLAKSLAAVREDPSLLIGINDNDIVLPKSKPSAGPSSTSDSPKIKKAKKTKVKKKRKKKKDVLETDVGCDNE